MEMRPLSLCLEAPGSCAAQFIESERHTAVRQICRRALSGEESVREAPPKTSAYFLTVTRTLRRKMHSDGMIDPSSGDLLPGIAAAVAGAAR
jgi:hypothetical protein